MLLIKTINNMGKIKELSKKQKLKLLEGVLLLLQTSEKKDLPEFLCLKVSSILRAHYPKLYAPILQGFYLEMHNLPLIFPEFADWVDEKGRGFDPSYSYPAGWHYPVHSGVNYVQVLVPTSTKIELLKTFIYDLKNK